MLAQMYSLDTLHAEIRTQKVRFHQLLVDGRLTGFAAIGPTGTPGVLKLHKLYIAPESHGLGLGKRLLNHCEAEAAKNGARRLILAVNKRNARAIAFYQRNGLAIIESVVSEIGGGFVMADFIMAKEV
jgi:ribosomal protein S18 acetylase RimI-like enzyme